MVWPIAARLGAVVMAGVPQLASRSRLARPDPGGTAPPMAERLAWIVGAPTPVVLACALWLAATGRPGLTLATPRGVFPIAPVPSALLWP